MDEVLLVLFHNEIVSSLRELHLNGNARRKGFQREYPNENELATLNLYTSFVRFSDWIAKCIILKNI